MDGKSREAEIIVVGAAILDVLAGPVDKTETYPEAHEVETVRMSTGGDAMNESVILARFGKRVHLVSRVGSDAAGRFILARCREEGIDTSGIRVQDGLETSINLVFVESGGERRFVTSRGGSLRMQTPEDLEIGRLPGGKIFMFASFFVSPPYTVEETARVFREAKEAGYLVGADMTKCKNGETLADIAPALRYTDILFPNWEEAALLSGRTDPDEIAGAFLAAGVGMIVLKLGAAGCLIRGSLPGREPVNLRIPAVPGTRAVDTTGAGDTFAAAFLCGLLEGMTPEECGRFANAAASVTVGTVGATEGLRSRAQAEERMRVYSTGYTPYS